MKTIQLLNLSRKLCLILILAIVSQLAYAYDFKVDGLCYDINADGKSVTLTYEVLSVNTPSYKKLKGNCTIPQNVKYKGKNYVVTIINSSAFYKCQELASIIIPSSVTEIGIGAFYGCSALSNVTIPNSVVKIWKLAFSHCENLATVIIPSSVTEIDGSAFESCPNLTSIIIESGNLKYDSRDNCNAIIETSTNTLITGARNAVIPNSVTVIGDYAFDNCSWMTSIDIPNSVKVIGMSAFSRCNNLTEVTIPNSVNIIGPEAFESCVNLTSVTIPDSVFAICYYAFNGCTNLTSVSIGNSVKEIGISAFSRCVNLKSVTLPGSVTHIDQLAFSGCDNLEQIIIKSLTPPKGSIFMFPEGSTILVPSSSIEAYMKAEHWRDYNIQPLEE